MSEKTVKTKEPLVTKRAQDLQALFMQPASEETYHAVEKFLYKEARLLDSKMFRTWLKEAVAEDVRYIVTSTELRANNERRYDLPDQVYLFDDDYRQLAIRVEHDLDPQNWRSSPQEVYCRFVTNIEVFETDDPQEFTVRSNCLLIRSRRSYQTDQFFCTRVDVLRQDAGTSEFKLKSRTIDYPERCVSGHNMLVYL